MQVLRDVKHFVKDYQGEKLHPSAVPGAILVPNSCCMSWLQGSLATVSVTCDRMSKLITSNLCDSKVGFFPLMAMQVMHQDRHRARCGSW